MLSALIALFRVANWLNWIMAALFAFLGLLLLVDPNHFRDMFMEAFTDRTESEAVFQWLLWSCLMVLPVAAAVHVILTRLVAMIRDTQAGAAFSESNAKRLTTIAWALLAINVVDLAYGQLSVWASAVSGEYFGWAPSLTGWFAVPLLLVLARLFRDGAAMREDLEGTV